MNYEQKWSGTTYPLEERKLNKTKKIWQIKKRFQLTAKKKQTKKQKKKNKKKTTTKNPQNKTALRKSPVPDYRFTLVFQQAEGN